MAEQMIVVGHAGQARISSRIMKEKKFGTDKDSFNRLVNEGLLNHNTWKKLLLPAATGPNGVNRYQARTLRLAAKQLHLPDDTFIEMARSKK
jgi:hypothetical protein